MTVFRFDEGREFPREERLGPCLRRVKDLVGEGRRDEIDDVWMRVEVGSSISGSRTSTISTGTREMNGQVWTETYKITEIRGELIFDLPSQILRE